MPRPTMSLAECAREDARRNYGSEEECIKRQKARKISARQRWSKNRRERIAKAKR